MRIMQCRESGLQTALAGYNETHVPLISSVEGSYFPAGYTDDLGIYYFIPSIANYLEISINQAINVFFISLLIIGFVISLSCFCLMFKDWVSRLISAIALSALTLMAYIFADVYIAAYFSVTAVVPLFLLWNQNREKPYLKRWLWAQVSIFIFAFSGTIIGYCNFIRSHAGTGVLVFLVSWIFLNKKLLKKDKLISVLTLFLFVSLPYLHFAILENQRDNFLTERNPLYQRSSIAHPKWHSIYIGFGYLENNHEISYSDAVSHKKALSINPNVIYCSNEYEQILKDQCFQLLKKDPLFVSKTILAKLLKMVFFILVFANFGLLLAFVHVRPSFRKTLPFFLAAALYSLPGILTMPSAAYVLGLISISTLFGLYMICCGRTYLTSAFLQVKGYTHCKK